MRDRLVTLSFGIGHSRVCCVSELRLRLECDLEIMNLQCCRGWNELNERQQAAAMARWDMDGQRATLSSLGCRIVTVTMGGVHRVVHRRDSARVRQATCMCRERIRLLD